MAFTALGRFFGDEGTSFRRDPEVIWNEATGKEEGAIPSIFITGTWADK